MNDQAIERLRHYAGAANELQQLRDRVEELEAMLGMAGEDIDRFVALALTPTERKIVGILFSWKLVRRETLYTALYGSWLECDQPEPRVIDVFICRVRKYLAPFDITIEHQPKAGWFLTEANKEKLALLAEQLKTGERRA